MPDAEPVPIVVPDPAAFPALPAHRAERWDRFLAWERPYFANLVGLVVEEIRVGYARLRLPFRPEVEQHEGVVHGGALATLIDTSVVPAIGSAYDEARFMATLTMHVDYLRGIDGVDAIAEGWVTRRGRSVVFCSAVVRAAGSDEVAASGALVYRVGAAR